MQSHNQTEVTVVADSIMGGQRITTLECFYPRIIHGEVMTHRVFSRNAQSSRAMPTAKVTELPVFVPDAWTVNRKGMSASRVLAGKDAEAATAVWLDMYEAVRRGTEKLAELGVHKQHANRALEPWTYIRVLITATQWDNFFDQRISPDAQPEIQDLARKMRDALAASVPNRTAVHRPYYTPDVPEQYADAVCAARCARVSYGQFTGERDVRKDVDLAQRLWQDKHMSPFEHVAYYDTAGGRHHTLWRTLREWLDTGGRLLPLALDGQGLLR
jgi:thymidylate synthase ThyX